MAKLSSVTLGTARKSSENENFADWAKRSETYLNELLAISAEIDPAASSLVGAVISFPVADGYAYYRVESHNPLTLAYIYTLDGYKAAPETIRGVTVNTVRQKLKFEKLFSDVSNSHDKFYASLKIGQIVHYNYKIDNWVRCEVTHDSDGKNALKPIALVGNWPSYDLPHRTREGSIYYGYYGEQIRNGGTMTPNYANIWESQSHGNSITNPATLQPISLEVPDMSQEEAHRASLWSKIKLMRNILNSDEMDPQIIIDKLSLEFKN